MCNKTKKICIFWDMWNPELVTAVSYGYWQLLQIMVVLSLGCWKRQVHS